MADEFMSVLLVVPPVALVASGHVHGSRAPGGKRIASGSHQNLRAAFPRVWSGWWCPEEAGYATLGCVIASVHV